MWAALPAATQTRQPCGACAAGTSPVFLALLDHHQHDFIVHHLVLPAAAQPLFTLLTPTTAVLALLTALLLRLMRGRLIMSSLRLLLLVRAAVRVVPEVLLASEDREELRSWPLASAIICSRHRGCWQGVEQGEDHQHRQGAVAGTKACGGQTRMEGAPSDR